MTPEKLDELERLADEPHASPWTFWQHRCDLIAAARREAALREALKDWMAQPSDHVHPMTPAEERLMSLARQASEVPQ